MWEWIVVNYVVFIVIGQDSFISALMSQKGDFMPGQERKLTSASRSLYTLAVINIKFVLR